jgi:hypothetical protein
MKSGLRSLRGTDFRLLGSIHKELKPQIPKSVPDKDFRMLNKSARKSVCSRHYRINFLNGIWTAVNVGIKSTVNAQ